jgi:hypothetical protein
VPKSNLKHPPIRRSRGKSLRGQPEIYDEIKRSRSFCLPESLLSNLSKAAASNHVSASEVLEGFLRQADLSRVSLLAVFGVNSSPTQRIRTSLALTDTAYQILIDFRKKHRLRSTNAAAIVVLQQILESTGTAGFRTY